jgi:hypothetical protein
MFLLPSDANSSAGSVGRNLSAMFHVSVKRTCSAFESRTNVGLLRDHLLSVGEGTEQRRENSFNALQFHLMTI